MNKLKDSGLQRIRLILEFSICIFVYFLPICTITHTNTVNDIAKKAAQEARVGMLILYSMYWEAIHTA